MLIALVRNHPSFTFRLSEFLAMTTFVFGTMIHPPIRKRISPVMHHNPQRQWLICSRLSANLESCSSVDLQQKSPRWHLSSGDFLRVAVKDDSAL